MYEQSHVLDVKLEIEKHSEQPIEKDKMITEII